MPDYGESPDLLEMRTKQAAARKALRGPVEQLLRRGRDRRAIHAAYRALFYPEGTLHPAAVIVLDDLAEAAGFGAASPVLDHTELAFLEGKRWLMLHLLTRFRLSPERAAALENELEKAR